MTPTVLIVFFMSLADPSLPPRMIHKMFESPRACETAFQNTMANMPNEPTVKVSGFCTKLTDLADRPDA
ncbi:MAG: hypothetical protein EOO61_04865 [Hymenobacter sp.]|nr:MAG: hypothetical protein EOO61_04865 [Hymenobacter sp.]